MTDQECAQLDPLLHCRGRFWIPDTLLYSVPTLLLAELAPHVLVYAVQESGHFSRREYFAFSPLFREVADGERLPLYEFLFKKDGVDKPYLEEVRELPNV